MTAAALSIAVLLVFWLIFVAVMAIKHSWNSLPLPAKILGAVWAIIGYIMDVVLNWTLFIIIFADLPREPTITAHCGRLKQSGNAYQMAVANWICKNLLDPFEVGGHCRG